MSNPLPLGKYRLNPQWDIPPIKMAKIKDSNNTKFCSGYREIRSLVRCWECKLVQPLEKTVWQYLKKLNIDLSYDLALHSCSFIPKKWRFTVTRKPVHKCECSVTHSYPTLFNPMHCRWPGFFVHGIFQARILEWFATSYSKNMCITTLFAIAQTWK